MYYQFSETIKYAKHFHILAINRGEKEGILKIKVNPKHKPINKLICFGKNFKIKTPKTVKI